MNALSNIKLDACEWKYVDYLNQTKQNCSIQVLLISYGSTMYMILFGFFESRIGMKDHALHSKPLTLFENQFNVLRKRIHLDL